jgi:enoyl-CoA hydratase/carnithine racemase
MSPIPAEPSPPPATTIEIEVHGPKARIWLNRPARLNAPSSTALGELIVAAQWVDRQRAVKVLIVGGRGRSFCSGADLTAAADDGPFGSPREAADAGRRMAEAIEGMRAVTIARIQGDCIGGGVVLATSCDLRVASREARFAIPETALGLPLAWGGIPRLVREVGLARTKELVLTCRPFSAEEAHAFGLVNRVVSEQDLDAEVDGLAATLEDRSSLTLEATKRHVQAVADGMVGTARAWNDADSLVAARSDPKSLAQAAA